MYLPILHHTGTGLFVGTDRIVLFELVRFRDSVRTVTLQEVLFGEEGVENALKSMAGRCSPSNLYVVTNLDTATVKHVVFDGPAFENYTDRSLWIQRQINSVLPGSEPNDLFCAQHVVLLTDTNRTRVLAGIVRAEVVESRSQLLRTARFRPIGLSTLPSVFPAAFMLDSDVVEGTSRLAWMSPDDGFRISITDGYMSELEYPLLSKPNEDVLQESMVIPNGLADRGGLLQKHTIPAAAMAMSRLYPGLQHLDFLDESTRTRNQGEFEKERALRFMGTVFGALFALLLVLLAVEWHLSRLQSRTQSELHAIAAPWRAMERRVDDVEQLRSRLRETSTIVASHSLSVDRRPNHAPPM